MTSLIKRTKVKPGDELPCSPDNIINSKMVNGENRLTIWYVETIIQVPVEENKR